MKIEFATGNAAFDEYGDVEVKRILEKIIEQVELGYSWDLILVFMETTLMNLYNLFMKRMKTMMSTKNHTCG